MRATAVPVNGKRITVDDEFSIMLPYPCGYCTPEDEDSLCVIEPIDPSYYDSVFPYSVEDTAKCKYITFRKIGKESGDFDKQGMLKKGLEQIASQNSGSSDNQKSVVCLDTNEIKTGFVNYLLGDEWHYLHLILTKKASYMGYSIINAYNDTTKEIWLRNLLSSARSCTTPEKT